MKGPKLRQNKRRVTRISLADSRKEMFHKLGHRHQREYISAVSQDNRGSFTHAIIPWEGWTHAVTYHAIDRDDRYI